MLNELKVSRVAHHRTCITVVGNDLNGMYLQTHIDHPSGILANSTVGLPGGHRKVHEILHLNVTFARLRERRTHAKYSAVFLHQRTRGADPSVRSVRPWGRCCACPENERAQVQYDDC